MKINNRYIPIKFLTKIIHSINKETKEKEFEILKNETCQICNSRYGDFYILDLNVKANIYIKFKVKICYHLFCDSKGRKHKIILCQGCHLKYHLS